MTPEAWNLVWMVANIFVTVRILIWSNALLALSFRNKKQEEELRALLTTWRTVVETATGKSWAYGDQEAD